MIDLKNKLNVWLAISTRPKINLLDMKDLRSEPARATPGLKTNLFKRFEVDFNQVCLKLHGWLITT